MNDLTLLIPAKFESESLPIFLEELKDYDYNKLVVLDESDLKTIESIKNFKNIEILHQKKTGYGNALIEGINYIKTDLFCIINADGSMNPNELSGMLSEIKNNNQDIVFGSRYMKNAGSDDDDLITLIGNFIFTFVGKVFFRLKISDILYTYLMGQTESFRKLSIKSNDFRFCVELPIKMEMSNMKYKCIPSYELKRIAGKKKVNAFKDGFLILIEMLRLFFDYKLLRKKLIK